MVSDAKPESDRMSEARAFFDTEVLLLRQSIRWGNEFWKGDLRESTAARLDRTGSPDDYSTEPLPAELIQSARVECSEVPEMQEFVDFVYLFAQRYRLPFPADVRALFKATR